MADEWVPREEFIYDICDVLKQSQLSDTDVQRYVYNRLTDMSAIPEFKLYLLYILVHEERATTNIRAAAGLLLKRIIMDEDLTEEHAIVLEQVKFGVVSAIGAAQSLIQATAAIIVTSIVAKCGLRSWPGLLDGLAGLLDAGEPTIQLGAIGVLLSICGDHAEDIHLNAPGTLVLLINKWLGLFLHDEVKIRRQAVSCVNAFVPLRSAAVLEAAPDFVEGLFHLASDPAQTIPVLRVVCEGMVQMLSLRADLFLPRMDRVLEFMLHCSSASDDLLALEACEFWSSFGKFAIAKDLIAPLLPQLIPVLLRNIVFSEFDIFALEAVEEMLTTTPDKESDIEPRGHRASALASAAHAEGADDAEDDDDESDNSDDEGQEAVARTLGQWNVRKSAGASLDVLARLYQDPLLELLMPAISEMMNSTQWKEREAGLLAIGAISVGCLEALGTYLPEILQHILTLCMHDERALVRKIACWTVARYSTWVVWQGNPIEYLGPFTAAILERMLDDNKLVQEAACAGFGQLCEAATTELVEYYPMIMATIGQALTIYQVRNLRLVYDVLGTLCENSGGYVARMEIAQLFVPALVSRWETIELGDLTLFALMECLTTVASTTRQCFAEFLPVTFARTSELLSVALRAASEVAETGRSDVELSSDPSTYITCALDLISGLADGSGPAITPYLTEMNLVGMVPMLLEETSTDVRQSTYAVLGDMAVNCMPLLMPIVADLLPILIDDLNPDLISVCNNAGWAIGEIALQIGADMDPWLPVAIPRLVEVINRPKTSANLVENMCITMGRIGIHSPRYGAEYLPSFIHNWCLAMRVLADDEEKASAFRGLCQMIHVNPQGVVDKFVLVADAISSWREPPEDLHDMFQTILHAFKDSMAPDAWAHYYSNFALELRAILADLYMVPNLPE
eukprot:c14125_g1_i1.p1 GENE.c14125_g1_i1~~c14125_g1_i1.p1  ORF type:complete len:912 (+),score=213.36 c14125_g1_i1:158-2893(+)